MRQLLNTLFITTEDSYLSLDGENIVIKQKNIEAARFPLHILQGIVCFSYSGASPALMGACAKHKISLSFCTPNGRFLARVTGEGGGNVLLRRMQYRVADNPPQAVRMARSMVFGKVYNARWVIERTIRDHAYRVDKEQLEDASIKLKELLPEILEEMSMSSLRGIEGVAAATYFSVFDEMILNNKEDFSFSERTRRPPLDKVNALLSFSYTLLSHDCASALESVGLDSYVGFMHADRSGRQSLALDLMEELRACMADRFALTLINNRMITAKSFKTEESGAVYLTDDGRKLFLKQWQLKKQEEITHPFLKEKIKWGLVPYVQALLMARFIRGDLDEYPPFLWK